MVSATLAAVVHLEDNFVQPLNQWQVAFACLAASLVHCSHS